MEDYKENILPLQYLLEACRSNTKLTTVILAGTSTQCGLPETLPVDENRIDEPTTFYDFYKLAAENFLKFYTRREFIKCASLRLTNVYGPGPGSSSADRGILNLMIRRALDNLPLTIYGSGDFIRDYIYIDDVVHVMLAAASYIDKINGKHLVLGSGSGYTVNEAIRTVAHLVSEETGKEVSVSNIDAPSGLLPIEFRNFRADTQSLQKFLNISTFENLDTGIKKTIQHFLKKS